jgi:hypothetical protein
MARLRDGITDLVKDDLSKTVDNVLVKPLDNGEADLILTHTLEEADDVVLKAEVVGRWHFNSAEHLQEFSDMLANSIRNSHSINGNITKHKQK